jgi:hypothetical protein
MGRLTQLALAATLGAAAVHGDPTVRVVPDPAAPYIYPYPFGPTPSGLQPRALPDPTTVFELALSSPGEILIVRSGDPEVLDSLERGRALTFRPMEARLRRTGMRQFAIAVEFPDFAVAYIDRDELSVLIRDLRQLERVDTSSASTELTQAEVRLRTRGGLEFALGVRFENRPVLQVRHQPQRGTAEVVRLDSSRADRIATLLEKLDGVLRRSGA